MKESLILKNIFKNEFIKYEFPPEETGDLFLAFPLLMEIFHRESATVVDMGCQVC